MFTNSFQYPLNFIILDANKIFRDKLTKSDVYFYGPLFVCTTILSFLELKYILN